jgi:hypothetical protein
MGARYARPADPPSPDADDHPAITQRTPMWLMPVSIICGRRAAGRLAQAVAVGAQERAALDDLARDRELQLGGSTLSRNAPPRGSRGTQHGLSAASGWRAAYQSAVHSHTLPAMSKSP